MSFPPNGLAAVHLRKHQWMFLTSFGLLCYPEIAEKQDKQLFLFLLIASFQKSKQCCQIPCRTPAFSSVSTAVSSVLARNAPHWTVAVTSTVSFPKLFFLSLSVLPKVLLQPVVDSDCLQNKAHLPSVRLFELCSPTYLSNFNSHHTSWT